VRGVLLAAVIAVMVGVAAGAAFAAEARPLPSFTVVSPEGREVTASSLTTEARWVLIYLKPGGTATSRLFAALAGWQFSPESMKRLVFIVEGPVDKTAAYLAKQTASGLGDLVWYADPEGNAAQALGLTGAPALMGIRDGAIDWTLAGVLNDPAAYASVVRTWIGAPPAVR
jgi:hypothetical protein